MYAKALTHFHPAADSSRVVTAAGYSPEELGILKDFGEDFFAGNYRQYHTLPPDITLEQAHAIVAGGF